MPVDTEFGRKRAIDQSSCNKDYSCLDGLCPSFVTVRGAEPRKPAAIAVDESLFDDLPLPVVAPLKGGFGMMIAGIGGSGVVTVGALIGMAAHMEGHAMSLFDLTGLSQKNGAVFSHVRIAHTPAEILSQKVGRGEADVLLAFDMVAALAPESAETLRTGHTRVIANCDVAPTASFQFDRNFAADPAFLLDRLKRATGKDHTTALDASALALALLGDTIGTNLFLVGVAAQQGVLPVSIDAIEAAVRLNGVAVGFNLKALRLGRLFAAFPERVENLARTRTDGDAPATLDALIAGREAHLRAYQGDALAARFRALVSSVQRAERTVRPGSETLTRATVQNYAKLLAYKDEYEVARLLSDPAFHAEIKSSFEDGGRIAFNLAPPMLPGRGRDGRPKKREFGAWIIPLFRILASMRGLRGTMFDPFGYCAERRTERALIVQYEAMAAMIVADLDEKRFDAALHLLSLADEVRGYGPVKETAVEHYRAELRDAAANFTNSAKAVAASSPPLRVTA
jgi:indolepyruvate ferredoxin oxidoreductase